MTYRVCYLFLIMLGLRIGECLGIEWSDIDFAKGTVLFSVIRSIKQKHRYLYHYSENKKLRQMFDIALGDTGYFILSFIKTL